MTDPNETATRWTPQVADTSSFAGADRADLYIESEHTIAASEVRAIRESAATDEAGEADVAPPVPAKGHVNASGPRTEPEVVVVGARETTPLSRLSLTPEGGEEVGTRGAHAKRGVRGALGKVGIRVAPGTAERAELEAAQQLAADQTTIRQATWTRAVGILVANQKGGVGKTPTSLLLGGVLAATRGGSVCIIEVSDDPGSLAFRAEGTPRAGIGELVRDVETITSAGQLAGYTAPQTSFASVIGSVAVREPLTGRDVVAVAGVVDDFYGVRVMDSGNQATSSAFQGALETADTLVIPVLNSADAVVEAVALLERLKAGSSKTADLARGAVILRLTDGRPENPKVLERLTEIIASTGISRVYEIPFDSHIAERGELTLSKLAPTTNVAFTAAAAAVVRSLQTSVK